MYYVKGICLINDFKDSMFNVTILEDKAKSNRVHRISFKKVHKIKHFIRDVAKAIPCERDQVIISDKLNLTIVGLTE